MQIGGNLFSAITFSSQIVEFSTLIIGGLNDINALHYLDAGASHVIVTSHNEGNIDLDRLPSLCSAVGNSKLVLDLSCWKRPGDATGLLYVVTNRWTKYTDCPVR
ncbi:hypothetical protein EON65_06905 [archaeon]|nr:MAG: hypothetical protein EON65_06905 [archaeon]